ncbi:MAG: hypothetical protein LQ346_008858, partial [Caloplaca aetnensis]
MKLFSPAAASLPLVLLLHAFPSVVAHSSQPQAHHPSLQNQERARIIQRQEGNPPTPPTPTIGGFSPPSLLAGPPGNHSLNGGHGPAIQPQPGASPLPSNNATSPSTTMDTSSQSNNNSTLSNLTSGSESHTNNSTTTALPPADLAVTTRQYTSRSMPRVDITLAYGSQRVTQTWEVREDGTIQLVPDVAMN